MLFVQVFAQSAKTVKADASGLQKALNGTEMTDSRCTSKELKEIMTKISYRTPSITKRLIQRIAEEKLGGFFAVFCSKDDFTYVSRGKVYCQAERDGVICYAFQHS
ncbi:ground-like domain protein [Cooperia oncophora]